jgi:hypothetical protein
MPTRFSTPARSVNSKHEGSGVKRKLHCNLFSPIKRQRLATASYNDKGIEIPRHTRRVAKGRIQERLHRPVREKVIAAKLPQIKRSDCTTFRFLAVLSLLSNARQHLQNRLGS